MHNSNLTSNRTGKLILELSEHVTSNKKLLDYLAKDVVIKLTNGITKESINEYSILNNVWLMHDMILWMTLLMMDKEIIYYSNHFLVFLQCVSGVIEP